MHPDAYTDMAALEAQHWWFQGRRKILNTLITSLHLPPAAAAKILEVGCGTGGNLTMLMQHGDITAVEMDAGARHIASQRHTGALSIYAGWLPDNLPDLDTKFDLICLFDVLEHIETDVPALQRLTNLLAPGGRVLLTVPAYPWLWSRHDEYHHHHRRYTVNTLQACINQAGLRTIRLSYFNTLLFPLAVIARITGKLFAGAGNPPVASPLPEIVNDLLCTLFASESRWLKHFNLAFGLSVFAIIAPDETDTLC